METVKSVLVFKNWPSKDYVKVLKTVHEMANDLNVLNFETDEPDKKHPYWEDGDMVMFHIFNSLHMIPVSDFYKLQFLSPPFLWVECEKPYELSHE